MMLCFVTNPPWTGFYMEQLALFLDRGSTCAPFASLVALVTYVLMASRTAV